VKVGIVGAGWYGCHIGLALAGLGFEVKIFDRNPRVLEGASGNNQFRLHLGFHYARHHGTRVQSRDGFQRFIERYGDLSAEVVDNIYAVPRNASLLDFQTYKMIMAASGIPFEEQSQSVEYLKDVDGSLRVGERVILLERARKFFTDRLSGVLSLGGEVQHIEDFTDYAAIDGERFDYVVDATWGHQRPLPIEVYFEPTILLYYNKKRDFPAITLVDGPLCSIYPTEDPQIVTLSSVPHTPLGRFAGSGEAREALARVNSQTVADRREKMEEQVSRNVVGFSDCFDFAGIQLGIKTKPIGAVDDRSCCVYKQGAVFSVMSGKIDTIFFATERILSMIESDRSSPLPAEPHVFRKNVIEVSPAS